MGIKKKGYALLGFLMLLVSSGQSQVLSPVKWSYAAKKTSATEVVLYLKAVVQDGWHIYSVNQKPGGPLKTSFKFTSSQGFVLIGKATEPEPIFRFEEVFKIQVAYFEKEVVFQQRMKLRKAQVIVKGTVEFMACTDKMCTPPTEVEFSIPVK